MQNNIINPEKITDLLQKNQENPSLIGEILTKAQAAKGLNLEEVAALTVISSPELLHDLFKAAEKVKKTIYGNRIVLFAPLYNSNFCQNECLYCAFRNNNQEIKRRALTQEEIALETKQLIEQGHKRIVLLAGESDSSEYLPYIIDSINTIYQVKVDHGEIRRINVELAPMSSDDFKQLKAAQIGTYLLFQETYHPKIYQKVHLSGKKADYNWRLTAMDRALQVGLDDVGLGVLFGLADWRFEVLALMQHVEHLNSKFGIGPHTISVPRLEPAAGSDLSRNPPSSVNDIDFCKIIAILRLAVPYTGIILSTRENQELRRKALALGVSQISAGSRTNPGGYAENKEESGSQFSLGDHRSLDEVISDLASLGYLPSLCTACYRSNRTGETFMEFAKSGEIKNLCAPNGLITFKEYLLDYASPATQQIGDQLIAKELNELDSETKALTKEILNKLQNGQRDLFL